MTQLTVVVLREQGNVYGPFTSEKEALGFAAYLTGEVDPAEVRPLQSPVGDLLGWRENVALPHIAAQDEEIRAACESDR